MRQTGVECQLFVGLRKRQGEEVGRIEASACIPLTSTGDIAPLQSAPPITGGSYQGHNLLQISSSHDCHASGQTMTTTTGLALWPDEDSFETDLEEKPLIDLYNKCWLGLNFARRGFAIESRTALRDADDMLKVFMGSNHPHFLSWMAYMACYSCDYMVPEDPLLLYTPHLLQLMPSRLLHVLEIIHSEKLSLLLCEAIVRTTIETFRYKLSCINKLSLQQLTKLYDLLETATEYNDVVRETMRRWAACAQQVAAQVHRDEGFPVQDLRMAG